MKLVFVALGVYSHVGGIERFNQRVVRCLEELRGSLLDDVRVLSLWDYSAAKSSLAQPTAFQPAGRSKIRMVRNFVRAVRELRPDVILYGHVILAPLAAFASLLSSRSKNLLVVHGYEVWGDALRPVPLWEPLLVRRVFDRIVSVSMFTANRMALVYGMDLSQFRILPNAVDVETSGREAAQCLPDTRYSSYRLLTVGRLGYAERYKGFGNVLHALLLIKNVFPGVKYSIVGDGPLRGELASLANELGVADHVQFHGYVTDEELERLYDEASVFIMPSKKEGFGIVFLEAWKHRLPVIAGNADASAEVVEHGVTGLTVNPDSVEEIAEAVLSLLRDPVLAARMGEAGYRVLLERYSHEAFRRRLEVILQESGARETPTV